MKLPAVPELPLETNRLRLRAFGPDDADALYAFHSDPGAVRYVPFAPRTREQTAEVWFKGELTSELDYGLLSREWPGR